MPMFKCKMPDGETFEFGASNKREAYAIVRDKMEPWTQKGDRISVSEWDDGTMFAVIDEMHELTDAVAIVTPPIGATLHGEG